MGRATFLGTDRLNAGDQLGLGQYIMSQDARFVLSLNSDGNLVEYSNGVRWTPNTGNKGATHLLMQTDGNLVLYTANNTPVWQSTATGGAAHLIVQTDGNLVTYNNSSGNPNWQSGTGGAAATRPAVVATPDRLQATPEQLNASTQDYLLSLDKRYALLPQSDGTLVLYGPGYHKLWWKALGAATKLVMQTDGNLVLYNGNTALWYTATGGTGTNRVVIQNDGNLVL